MPRLKLTRPGFENYTGYLLGVQFVNGVSVGISQHDIDIIAASQGGVLIDDEDNEIGGASPVLRWTHEHKPDHPGAPFVGVPPYESEETGDEETGDEETNE